MFTLEESSLLGRMLRFLAWAIVSIVLLAAGALVLRHAR